MTNYHQQAIDNMKETLELCAEAKALGYPGASKKDVEATRKLTETRLKHFESMQE